MSALGWDAFPVLCSSSKQRLQIFSRPRCCALLCTVQQHWPLVSTVLYRGLTIGQCVHTWSRKTSRPRQQRAGGWLWTDAIRCATTCRIQCTSAPSTPWHESTRLNALSTLQPSVGSKLTPFILRLHHRANIELARRAMVISMLIRRTNGL